MKMIAILLSLYLSNWASASPHSCADMPEGFHEWGTFGEKTVYLYHFPMFGSVHSYQILMKAEVLKDGKKIDQQVFDFKKSHPGTVVVTSPSKDDGEADYWSLPDYSRVGVEFQARIHYRDAAKKDTTLVDHVTIKVTEVLLSRLMNSPKVGEKAAAALTYYYFGDKDEAYLLHQAFWDPDFDQILQVVPVQGLSHKRVSLVSFSDRLNDEAHRLNAKDTAAGIFSGSKKSQFQVLSQLHEFKIDLQR